MKIAHVYAQNLDIFNDALEATGCRINGSRDLNYLMKSIANYNARDVMGLIVFCQYMTKKTLKLIRAFDDMFVFNPLPIIVICDDAEELYAKKKLRVKHSPLFLIDSIEGTISDVDVKRIFTTLSCMSDDMYDLSGLDIWGKHSPIGMEAEIKNATLLADEVLQECAALGGKI